MAKATQVKLQKQAREAELKQLMFEGYQFDLTEELNDSEAMGEDEWRKYVGKIKTRFQRSPVGRPAVHPDQLTVAAADTNEAELAVKVRQFALKNKVDFKTAYEKLTAEKA